MAAYTPIPNVAPGKTFFGTKQGSVFWLCTTDSAGIEFASCAHLSLLFAICVAVFCVVKDSYNRSISLVLGFLVLMCHIKTIFLDPGVPSNAHPLEDSDDGKNVLCGRCEGYKASNSHHDRVSQRCMSRMDHFCPWINNAIGARNQKDLFLFMIYCYLFCIHLLLYLTIPIVDIRLVLVYVLYPLLTIPSFFLVDRRGPSPIHKLITFGVPLSFICFVYAAMFSVSMILNQLFGLRVGLGTIDRMKIPKGELLPEFKPVPFNHVFGDWWIAYFLPLNPFFKDEDTVFQYRLCDTDYCKRESLELAANLPPFES